MNDVVLADAGLPSRIERLTAALSTSTQRCYRNGWRKWEAFALEHGATLFPATPEALAAFVEHLAAAVRHGAGGRNGWTRPRRSQRKPSPLRRRSG